MKSIKGQSIKLKEWKHDLKNEWMLSIRQERKWEKKIKA